MNNERLCAVCGKPVSRKDSGGLVKVYPDGAGGERREYFCADHNPSPPTPKQIADREQQDLEAAIAALRAEEQLIRRLADLERPVTPVDRANVATELVRMLDRFSGLQNELRRMQGKPLTPTRPEWRDKTAGQYS